ncbi:TadE/TadG family type IV pilus assembly protein [Nocardioides donggukensis]|uniref:Pilus assembly protein n=1 Tax=Nocardioides donggukensis TaxID=2774019 RepID=A0A927Q0P1_9ACTN|nr:TadE/TadG family type IV pilus assembly protein [Nocardioides donggukensis]MBD8869162.1 pilus assembly protein [Nocardioides donggukensis]
MTRPRRAKDESGAYAVLFALLASFLVAMGVLAVDLGNAVARKSDVQGQADFGALGAARNLNGNTGTIPAAVYQAVADSMNSNRPQNGAGVCSDANPCVTAAQLQACTVNTTTNLYDNGCVRRGNGGLQVFAPASLVDYGFAGIFGTDNKDVQAHATVKVLSPLGALPVYAVAPCDYGRQTITDPANGHVTPVPVPTLAFDGDTNNTQLTGVTPQRIDVNQFGQQVQLTGSRFQNAIHVGFFPSDGGAPVVATSFTDPGGGLHPFLPPVPWTANNNSSKTITVPVPTAVAGSEKVYYIRVYELNGPLALTGRWSDKNQAPAFRVGDPVLECDAGSSSGNFGALKLQRTDVPSVNDQLAMNMATNLQAPLTLTKHQTWLPTGLCVDGLNGAVVSALPNPGLRPGTNCVDTDTGLPANATTSGMITGSGIPAPGRLTTKPTTPGCNGGTNRTVNASGSYSINNDVLTCFITDGTTSLADFARPNYTGDAVLDPSIYDSPRFFYVPVLHIEPANGGSLKYSIIDFRPAFLTDEAVAASSIRGSSSASADNGVTMASNKVESLKVVFFNSRALPTRTSGQVTDYFGVGPRIIRLVD